MATPVPHKFNYELMKQINGDKQMTDASCFVSEDTPLYGRLPFEN